MIISTGFHGSGTSAVTKSLHKLGIVFKGPVSTGPNWENKAARRINEGVLFELTGSDWKFLPDWDKIANYNRSITANFPDINWKDPRACLTLPIWRDHKPKVIWIKRNIDNVIKTYQRRHRKKNSEDFIRELVAGYESRLERALVTFRIPYIKTNYEEWYKNRNLKEVGRVLAFCLGMPEHQVVDKRGGQIRVVVDGLRMPLNQ